MAKRPVRIILDKRYVFRFLFLTVLTLHLLNAPAVWFRYSSDASFLKNAYVWFFSVSSEGVLSTWYSAAALITCSMLLAIISAENIRRQRPYTTHWVALSLIFALMSLDEAMAIHERFSRPLQTLFDTSGPLLFAWVIPGFVFVLAFVLCYLRFLTTLSPRTRNLFLLSGSVYILGVLGIEMIGSAYYSAYGSNLTYGIIATVEEVLEMSGIALFIYALVDCLEEKATTIAFSVSRQAPGTPFPDSFNPITKDY